MWTILIVLGLGLFLSPIIMAIMAFARVSGLEQRVSKLEAALSSAAKAVASLDPALGAEPMDAAAKDPAPFDNRADVATAKVIPESPTSLPPMARTEAMPVASDPVSAVHTPENAKLRVSENDLFDRFMKWLTQNWVYALAGVSLAFAGIFFVQYGIEHGLLSPTARVLSGVAFGIGLIGAGIYVQRRSGDEGDEAMSLPSVLIGAGLVSIFAATLAARQMYGLIGPEAALILHVITALAAIALGWVFGPILFGLGLIGGFVAPFVVGGSSDAPDFLYIYYLLLAAIGLAADYLRRWGWLSVMALALGYSGIALIALGMGSEMGNIAALVALLVLAATLPTMRIIPSMSGATLTEQAFLAKGTAPFPALLIIGANVVTAVFLVLISLGSDQPIALWVLVAMALAFPFWMQRAPALADATFVPAAAVLGLLGLEIFLPTALSRQFMMLRVPEAAMPLTVTAQLLAGAALSLVFAIQARRSGALARVFTYAAALFAPAVAILLEFGFQPARVLGAYPWALQVMALAGGMVWLATYFARAGQREGVAYSTLSALALIALAMFTVSTGVALSLALSSLIVAAAWLGRRFALPEMAWFGATALAVVSYRLLIDPGLDWAMDGPLVQVMFAYGGAIAAIVAARHFSDAKLLEQRAVLEIAAVGLGAVLADVLILRAMDAQGAAQNSVRVSLFALPWLIVALSQLINVQSGAGFPLLRRVIAALAGAGAAFFLVGAMLISPLWEGRIFGPWLLDTSFVAYIIPAAILLGGIWALPKAPIILRIGLGAGAGALALLYTVIQIRRFWNGDFIAGQLVIQGELYTYTVALMILGAGLIYLAIRQQSGLIRRAGMAVIALTVAKVFLWDAAGLSGLMRVVSFAGLGLALLGLAQLNRWAAAQMAQPREGG